MDSDSEVSNELDTDRWKKADRSRKNWQITVRQVLENMAWEKAEVIVEDRRVWQRHYFGL